jgi:hypothetical protein
LGLIAAKMANMKQGGDRKDQHAYRHVDREEAAVMINVSRRTVASAQLYRCRQAHTALPKAP